MNQIRFLFLILSATLPLAACAPTPGLPATTTPEPTPVPATAVLPTSEPTAVPTPQETPQLIDVDGRKLFIGCQGTGHPTVILEAGLGVYSGTWTKVEPAVATFTRVCRYDRAGLGQSESGPLPRTSQRMVYELHTLLTKAAIPGPYVLVGQSLGGLNVQLYASTYPGDVAGLVLVDSLHPNFDDRIEKLLTPAQAKQRREELEMNEEHVKFADIQESERQVATAGRLPDVPLVVIRHGLPFEGGADWPTAAVEQLWTELQADLAKRTSHGKVILAQNSHHRIQEYQPDVVSAAIQDVVNAASSR